MTLTVANTRSLQADPRRVLCRDRKKAPAPGPDHRALVERADDLRRFGIDQARRIELLVRVVLVPPAVGEPLPEPGARDLAAQLFLEAAAGIASAAAHRAFDVAQLGFQKGTDGKRIRPSTFPKHRFGPLRFVPRPSGPSLLVVDGLRASFSRQTGQLRGFRRATDRARRSCQGLTTVVMFLLVPQVKLRKRLDVARAAERWSGQLPALIEQQLRSE